MPTSHTEPVARDASRDPCANSAAALNQTLEALGVEYLFGMEAPAALHALLQPGGITPITVRDERSGAFMADGYARVSGKPGVCAVGGVGATNLVQGIVESWLASTPVVLLVEEGSGTTRHRNDLQDIDRGPIFASITKWTGQIEAPERVAELTAHAFRVATTGRPGPVYVGCPWDVVSLDPRPVAALAPAPAVYPAERSAPDPEAVERAAQLIRAAERPVIVAGGGVLVSGATDELADLARLLGAPVAATPSGKGAFDEFDALSAGVVGSYTSGVGGRGRTANEIVRRADLVVLVGTKTGSGGTANWTVPDPAQTVLHLDVDPQEIGRNYPGSTPLVADAKLGLRALVAALEPSGPRAPWSDHDPAGAVPPVPNQGSGEGFLDPEDLFAVLQDHVDDRTVIAADAGYCAAWALDRLRLRAPGRRFVAPRGYGTLGYGLPAAIGAKLASPSSTVICVTGDGGMGYALAELETAARCGVAVTVIVFNNSALGWSRHYNRHFYGYTGATDFLDVDYAAVARGLRCDGVRVSSREEFAAALKAAVTSTTTTVIDARMDPEVRPPVDMFD